MSKSSTDEYQARVIELAHKELANRNLSQADIDNRYEELLEEQDKVIRQELTEMMAEDYSVLEKLGDNSSLAPRNF
jgi:hypothetical protein